MRWSVLALVAVAACADSAAPAPARADAGAPHHAPVVPAPGNVKAVAFVDIAVVGMETPAAAEHQTVIVRDGAIAAIGPVDHTDVPADAEKVDGRGKWLVPGLHDMHVHLDGTRGMLELFIASGVTSVRNMAGSPRTLALRDKIARGELLGPTIATAGPFVDGARPRWEQSDVVATPADAERVIAAEAAAGYDFVKIYNGLSLASYDAIAASARVHGLRLVGHVPFAVPLQHVLDTGQASIEHLAGYAEAIERADSPVRHRRTAISVIKRWLFADPDKIPGIAAETAKHGVWNCPTLVTAVVYSELWRGETPMPDHGGQLDIVSPDWRARWDPRHSPKHLAAAVKKAALQAGAQGIATELSIVKELAAAGAPLLAGTDTPNPYVIPGASLHQELALFVAAGLTPYAALRTATIDAADFLGDTKGGRIAPGAHADLVMLDADPLADIHALDRISGVMVHGRWLDADHLHQLHDELVAEYKTPAWEQPVDVGSGEPKPFQYVITDNSAVVGAYAVARQRGTLLEKQTLEDETTMTHTAYAGGRVQSLAIDIERPEGTTHVEHRAPSDALLIGPLTPASATRLVEGVTLEVDQKTTLSVAQPDADAPAQLRRGRLEITRLPGTSETQRVFRLRLVIDRVAWAARVVVDSETAALPSVFRISSTTRPVVRAWKRR